MPPSFLLRCFLMPLSSRRRVSLAVHVVHGDNVLRRFPAIMDGRAFAFSIARDAFIHNGFVHKCNNRTMGRKRLGQTPRDGRSCQSCLRFRVRRQISKYYLTYPSMVVYCHHMVVLLPLLGPCHVYKFYIIVICLFWPSSHLSYMYQYVHAHVSSFALRPLTTLFVSL
jgi:hypothetical protein